MIALQQEPDTLHPGVGSMMARTIVLAPIFVGCMGQNEKAEWIPLGCETVPTIDNGGAKWVGEGADKHLEVTYKIKKGWRWTDGTPVTTKDVLAWWKLNMDPEFEVASRVGIEKIYDFKVVDDNTVTAIWLSNAQAKAAEAGTLKGNVPFEKFVTDYKDAGLAATGQPVVDSVYWTYIGWWPAHIVSKTPAKDQAKSDFAKKPLGDGAYGSRNGRRARKSCWRRATSRSPWATPRSRPIVWRFFGETNAVLASLQKGEIDAITSVAGVTPSNSPDLDKIAAAGIYNVTFFTEYSWEHIDLNVQKFPLDDLKVRQALYYAIDKKTIIDTLYYGKYAPAELPGAILKTNSGFYTDDFTKYTFDEAKAKALLEEAGWDCKALPCTKKVTVDGKEVTKNLEITLMTTDRADRQKLAQVDPGHVEGRQRRHQHPVPVWPRPLRRLLRGRPALLPHLRCGHLHLGGRRRSRVLGPVQLRGHPDQGKRLLRPEQPRLVQQGRGQGPERRGEQRRLRGLPGQAQDGLCAVLQGLDHRSAGHPALRERRAGRRPHRLQELHLRPDQQRSVRLERLAVGVEQVA